jgi:hypothetical protein
MPSSSRPSLDGEAAGRSSGFISLNFFGGKWRCRSVDKQINVWLAESNVTVHRTSTAFRPLPKLLSR